MLNGDLPSVSVVIPALNCAHEVDACIAALKAQDYPPSKVEIIVADNGSTDGTLDRLADLDVRTVLMPERGRSRALNAGLRVSEGELILTTDMGCVARPDWIRNIVACFADPEVGCVAGEIQMIPTGDNLAIRYQARNRYMSTLHALGRNKPPYLPFADGANASFRRAVFDAIGDFNESFYKAADVEICYRLLILTHFKIVFCPDCLVDEAGEPSLKALLRQRYRIGMGMHLLRARFPEFFTSTARVPTLKERYWWIREKLAGFGQFSIALIERDRDLLEDIVVGYLMRLAQQFGYRKGAAYQQCQMLQPVPLNTKDLEIFLSTIGSLDKRALLRRARDFSSSAHC